jgi:hypothetical protein
MNKYYPIRLYLPGVKIPQPACFASPKLYESEEGRLITAILLISYNKDPLTGFLSF